MKKDIISQFKIYLTDEKKVSPSSADSYCRDVKSFVQYLDNTASGLSRAGKTDVLSFIVDMQKEGKADASISRAVSSLRTFFGYLLQHSLIKSDPTFGIKLPRSEKKATDILSTDEIDTLLDIKDEMSPLAIRDKAMFEIMYATGIGVTELVSLKLSDVDTDLGYIRCCRTKNIRIVPLGKPSVKALEKYLTLSRPVLLQSETDALFVNYLGVPISRQGFWKILKEYAKKAGIKKDITPRTLRASFALHLIENGADLKAVQEMMGHKDIASTMSYARLSGSGIREIYNKTHPRS